MELPKSYDHKTRDQIRYQEWMDNGLFRSEPDEREPYVVLIPPPNVTGVLHMGHMLNNTIQDVLVRRARLLGKNACWVPGTDHASIATEAKVVKKLEGEGIKKSDLSREEFMKHAWEWTDKYGGTILEQLKRLGASCDWERTRFTLEDDLSDAVRDVFIDLYNKGLIYKGVRMINWDVKAQTALSDEEVIHREVNAELYYIKYSIVGSNEHVTIATTRPETILGDTAICVHPEDERYKHLKGKKAIVPLIDREIPIIQDEYVDREFGTGCLKVTPAHDVNDYELGLKHNLPSIDILNDDGTLNEKAVLYVGEDGHEVRKKLAKELEGKGVLIKTEELLHKVGFSERTSAVIEPKLSLQWFLNMKALAKPALEGVLDGSIKFYPENSVNTYKHWMENIKDWCISRQLWWGHRIPAYYYGEGSSDFVIAKDESEALVMAREKSGNPELESGQIIQDEDALDTWFSSWLWPISVFDGFKNHDSKELAYYYPTHDLVTAPDIMFFWVARMIMAGYEYKNLPPFRNVYYTGMVRDKQRRKMSKQLGNSPDPIDLIEQYGADGVRVGMLLSSPAGNDLLFDEALCGQGRNFSNKLWNAFRLIKGWTIDAKIEQSESEKIANEWFESVFHQSLETINNYFDRFRISDALMSTYRLTWDEFCSWYLEMVKPEFGKAISRKTYDQVIVHFENLLRILHPFTPFISEEIYQSIQDRGEDEFLMMNNWPAYKKTNNLGQLFEHQKNLIAEVRNLRKQKQISFKEALDLKIILKEGERQDQFDSVVKKLLNLNEISYVSDKQEGSISFVIGLNEYFIPMEEQLDPKEERKKLVEELNYQEGFLSSINKKLSNERFVDNAPEKVVEVERKKKADAEAKIELLKKQLELIGN